MGKYVSIGQLRTQIQTSFASLKTYMDEKVRDPILNTAQQAKVLADSVVQRANAGEFKGEKGDQGNPGPQGPKGDAGAPVTITMNGQTHSQSEGNINLGTVVTEHQSLSAYRTSSAQDVIDATKVSSSQLRTVRGNTLISNSDLPLQGFFPTAAEGTDCGDYVAFSEFSFNADKPLLGDYILSGEGIVYLVNEYIEGGYKCYKANAIKIPADIDDIRLAIEAIPEIVEFTNAEIDAIFDGVS